jgi:hypothetical protein
LPVLSMIGPDEDCILFRGPWAFACTRLMQICRAPRAWPVVVSPFFYVPGLSRFFAIGSTIGLLLTEAGSKLPCDWAKSYFTPAAEIDAAGV